MLKESYEDQFTVEPKLDENGKAFCEGWHPEMDLSLEGLKKGEMIECLDPMGTGLFFDLIKPKPMAFRIYVIDKAILKCLHFN